MPADPRSEPGAVTRHVPARVGLVGNPSDGFGGAVLATVVPARRASVVATPTTGIRFRTDVDAPTWRSVDEWLDATRRDGHGGERRIISASLWALVHHLHARGVTTGDLGVELAWSGDIPRSVGLAGSSALAVAAVDATAAAWAITLDPRVVAALALAAERDVLGIAAGWQDRIVQSIGRTVLVDASITEVVDGIEVPDVREITPPPTHAQVIVAWHSSTASSSDEYHQPLRRDPTLAAPMAELAALARSAATALAAGDLDTVGDAIDATWRVRQSAAPLRRDHAALVDLARTTGLPATTPGSGGSVVALAAHDHAEEAVAALTARGCEVVTTPLA